MPELPEVETVRRGLRSEVVGRRIDRAEPTGVRTLRRHPDRSVVAPRLVGTTIDGVGRRGKFLAIGLSSGDALVVHLGMSGQLLVRPSAEERPRHTHVVLGLDDGRDLRFVDPRTFGEVFVTRPSVPGGLPDELGRLGFDPLEDRIGAAAFLRLLAGRRTRLKSLLMDQGFVAGIGNIYSDEILFGARLAHDRPANGLSPPEGRRLHRSMLAVLDDAVARRGSSLADAQYRDVYGQLGQYQLRHRVYGREGQPCTRCRTPIRRARVGGRSGYYCPRCQT
ncbi:MAG TPA: bifunctional DNA-formamidopyrimidine glycosylase/DNA-(apurinic or apyrimidinic site) lyase [Acidimicrobiales bacterium]|nr:bifunctional DNA-formamidopyrimidine glycosylase/DNA-(apurinic or apyrimidinic site) lyase [Acidimicrobiales bacterium]